MTKSKNKLYFGLTCLLLILSNQSCFLQDNFKIKTSDPWVQKVEWAENHKSDGGHQRYLLVDSQENTIEEQSYYHLAVKVLTTDGIQANSRVEIIYDPTYQNLVLHGISIYRSEKRIDKIKTPLNFIKKEADYERHLYDGSISVIAELTDIRLNDIIEYSYTIVGYNPILKDEFSISVLHNYSVPVERIYNSVITNRFLNTSFTEKVDKPEISEAAGIKTFIWDQRGVSAVDDVDHVPSWYPVYHISYFSTYKNWEEVVNWALPLYSINSSDRTKIKSAIDEYIPDNNLDSFILKSIRFVQDEVRYLGFENGINAFKPRSPVKILNQRYGDCKESSLLLCSILRSKDIESYPVLVNTNTGYTLNDRIPSHGSFNHCIVALHADDKIFFIDPTINDQGGNLKLNYTPRYEYGLMIKENQSQLTVINDSSTPQEIIKETFVLDSINGGAILHVETIHSSYLADNKRSYFKNLKSDIEKNYEDFYANQYPETKIDSLYHQDTSRNHLNEFKVIEKYTLKDIWETQENNNNSTFTIYPQTIASYIEYLNTASDTLPFYLGAQCEIIETIRVEFPEAWYFSNFSKKIENEYFHFNFNVERISENIGEFRYRYWLKKEFISAEDVKETLASFKNIRSDLGYTFTHTDVESQSILSRLFFVAILILGLLSGLYLCWKVYYYDPNPEKPAPIELKLGGILILPTIGLVLSPFRLLIDMKGLLMDDSYYSLTVLSSLWSSSDIAYGKIGAIYVLFSFFYNIWLFIFLILLIYLFFMRRSNVPILIICFYFLTATMQITDNFIAQLIDNSYVINFIDIGRSLIVCCIWIPYFYYSQRVKNTFQVKINT